YLPQRFPLMLTGGLILFAAWGAGTLLLELLGLRSLLLWAEQTAFAGGLGLAGLSLLMLVSGLAGVMDRGLAIAALLLAGLGGLAVVLRDRRQRAENSAAAGTHPASRLADSIPGWLWASALVVMLPFLLSILLGSMLPSTDFDVKEYHLQGPKEFYQNGRIGFLPHNVYTSFPFLTEMLSLLAMVVHGDWMKGALAGKLVLSAFAPLSALGLYAMGSRWHSAAAGLLAAMIFLTTPWVYRISTIAYAEGGLSCYVLLSLAAGGLCLRELAEPSAAMRSRACYTLPLLAGLLAGSGMACKYPGLISAVIPVGVLLLAGRLRTAETKIPQEHALQEQTPQGDSPATIPLRPAATEPVEAGAAGSTESIGKKRWRWPTRADAFYLLAFSAGVLLAVGPWLLKNLIETGNPVYPLAWTIFGGADWDAALNGRWRAAHSPADYDVWRLLWFWTTDVTIRNDWLSALLYALAPLAWFTRRHRLQVRWLWGILGWLFLSWWLLTHRLDRFWIPMIPVAALLAGIGAMSFRGRLWSMACGTAVVLAALFNLTIVTSGAAGYNALLIDLDYSLEWTAQRTARGVASLNQLVPTDSLVLCVGEAQVF
ncbi:MAG: hypothetical protein KDA79_24200, partial [Planctomycetaceae bacterium]|nr:hypothetical protein [Planctomycetaceae bacterium]